MIHTSYSGSTYNTQEDISDASVLLNKFNTGDGQGKVWDGYCLAHLFTYRVLSNGLLGLSNIASPSATTTGGICSTSFFSSSSGTRIIYNTALSSYTSSSNPLVFVEEVLVTGHEIGHIWGSYHDPATTPSSSNVFIMNQYAQDGSQPTHKMFSNCSRTSIGAVLSAKASQGNSVILDCWETPAVLMPVSYAQRPCADLYLYSYTGFPPSTFIFAIRMVGATKVTTQELPSKVCEDYETISKAFVIGRSQEKIVDVDGSYTHRKYECLKEAGEQGHLLKARDSIEMVLADIGRNSYLSLCVEMCWSILQHVLFQHYLVKKPQQTEVGSKKERFGDTAADIEETYHFFHKVNMALSGHLAEMYLTQALQCHFSAPHWSRPLMVSVHVVLLPLLAWGWPGLAPQVDGHSSREQVPYGHFLGTRGTSAPRLYHGVAALPMCSITGAYSRQLLYEGFTLLLLHENSSLQGAELGEAALTTLQQVHHLAEEAQAMLCANIRSVGTVLDTSDSGFDVIEWWASIGLVACYCYMGTDSLAQEHYASIDGISGDSPVPVLHGRQAPPPHLQRRAATSGAPPLALHPHERHLEDVCQRGTARELQHWRRRASSGLGLRVRAWTGAEVWLGLLLACEWLLQLHSSIWEEHSHEEGVRRSVVQGFAQDVDTMAHLIKLLPEAIPKYGTFSFSEEETPSSQGGRQWQWQFGYLPRAIQAMKMFAYKHLPRSLEVPGGTTGGVHAMTLAKSSVRP
eukprot:Em0017g532a